MSSVPPDPFRLPVRILTGGGLVGLAALTLVSRGATRMYATPWVLIFAAITVVPFLILWLRLVGSGRPFLFPTAGWRWLAAATIIVPVASALLSPYRAPSLLLAAGPVAAACLFLLLHDWLHGDPEPRRKRLEQGLAGAALTIALASLGWWLRDVATLKPVHLLSRALFDMRNPHPLGHSNYTAGLMLLGLPLFVLTAYRASALPRRAGAVATGLMLLHLFTSGSRGGLIGLAVLGVAGLAVVGLSWKRFFFLALGLVAFAALLAYANPRIRSLLGPRDALAPPNISSVQRTAMAEAGLMMGADRPLLGWGPGTTPLAYPRYRHALDGGVENALQLHSAPVQLWAETGAAGLLAALLFAGLVARHWRRAPAAAVTLAGYGVFALTDYQLDVPVFAAALAALAALLATPAAAPAGPPSRAGLGLLTVGAATVIVLFGARDRAPALNTEALALAKLPDQRQQAVARLNESLALNPDQEIAHFNLGWLLVVADPARAEQHFLAAARLVPDKGGVYFGLGLARLNQGRSADAARGLALEGVNDPAFLASPWWTVPAIAALRDAAAAEFPVLLDRCSDPTFRPVLRGWRERQVALLKTLTPRFGRVSPGPELSYRRQRPGYLVLMRQPDLPWPVDLYDVREDPRFPAAVSFKLPDKGWLPAPALLKLLDAPATGRQ